MKRIFILVLNITLLALIEGHARSEQPRKVKVPRIGILSPGSGNPAINAFRQGLHEHGWVEGQNIAIEYGFADGNENRLLALATELVHGSVDIIVVTSPRAAEFAKKLTKTIPIIVTALSDPVGSGLVNSLSEPGRNITGLSYMSPELNGKRLETLKEMIPDLSGIALLSHRSGANLAGERETQAVARSLGVRLQILNVQKPDEIENVFSSMLRGKAGAVLVGTQSMFLLHRRRIIELAAKTRLPAIYHRREYVEDGGLVSYGPNHADLYHRAAYFVDRILKGSKPEDLPVEQPTKFELVVNLKTAKQIGLVIPSEVLMWADKVIE